MKIAINIGLLCCICMTIACNRSPVCGESVLQNLTNPQPDSGGNKLKAEVVQVNCGATVDFGLEVRILRDDGKPLGQGDGAIFSTYRGTPQVSVRWTDGNTLEVQCPDCKAENITLKTTKQNFVSIKYAFD